MSKRSRSIQLHRLRKAFAMKPVAVAIASVGLTACADNRQEALVYANADDCNADNPEYGEQCATTYQQALSEAQRIGPKYRTQRDCEYEFGYNQCQRVEQGAASLFMPFMAGYMLSSALSSGQYFVQPLFTSYNRRSPMYNRWYGAGGEEYGEIDIDIDFGKRKKYRTIKVPRKTFEHKPTVTRTISRGGFGSSVRAKSSWGSSRKSGWGG